MSQNGIFSRSCHARSNIKLPQYIGERLAIAINRVSEFNKRELSC